MTSLKWKKNISVGLSIFALLIGFVGLTGCEGEGEELEREEELEEKEELEEEED